MHLTPDGPVVLFGGSFDPPTLAHITLASLAAEALSASRLVYVLAAVSPHKLNQPPASDDDRLAMLRLALLDCPQAEVDTRELHRSGPSYTIDTLTEWRSEVEPTCTLRLLIGTDQARVFHRWHRWRDILSLTTPAVMVRSEDNVNDVLDDISQGQGASAVDQWRPWMLDLPRMPQRSTMARTNASSGLDLDDQVVSQVQNYITSNDLYRGIAIQDASDRES